MTLFIIPADFCSVNVKIMELSLDISEYIKIEFKQQHTCLKGL